MPAMIFGPLMIAATATAASGPSIVSPRRPKSKTPITQSSPVVASNGRDFLWVWIESKDKDSKRKGSPANARDKITELKGARVSARGKILDKRPLQISKVMPWVKSPKVVSNGKDYLVVWKAHAVFAMRIGRNGKLIDKQPVRLTNSALSLDAAFDGEQYVIMWSSQINGDTH